METFKIGILEPEDFSEKAIEKLGTYGNVALYDGGEISVFLLDKEILFVRLRYNIDDAFLKFAPKLKYICSPTTGLNHISISNENINIVCLKGEFDFLSSIRATSEHVFGITLGLLRQYSHAFLSEDNPAWNRDLYKGHELYNSKIGIIGLGRIGKLIAKYFTAFDASVSYYDTEPQKDFTDVYISFDSIEELIDSNDIIILAANYIPENTKLLNKKHIQMMKGKYFVNAARGEMVDEISLLEAIEENIFAGVAIDVLSEETQGHPSLIKLLLLQHNRNLIITPHIGGATYTSMKRTEEFICDKLIELIKDQD